MAFETSEKVVRFLNGQNWHDSVLFEIHAARSSKGDPVSLTVSLRKEDGTNENINTVFMFRDCWLKNMNLNGGVVSFKSGEHISDARACVEGGLIDSVVSAWSRHWGENRPPLIQFEMALASTGSVVELVFGTLEVIRR